MDRHADEAEVFTFQQYQSRTGDVTTSVERGDSGALVLSTFSPVIGSVNTNCGSSLADALNNWTPELLPANGRKKAAVQDSTTDLWVPLSNENFVCAAVSASFDVCFEFNDGFGCFSYQHIQVLPSTGWNPALNNSNAIELNCPTSPAYFASFLAWEATFSGIYLCQIIAKHAKVGAPYARGIQRGQSRTCHQDHSYWSDCVRQIQTGRLVRVISHPFERDQLP